MNKDIMVKLLKIIEAEAEFLLKSVEIDNKEFLNFNNLLLKLYEYESIDDSFVLGKIKEIQNFKIIYKDKFFSKLEVLFKERFGRITNENHYARYGSLKQKQKYILGVLDKIRAIDYYLDK
jgi:hypothetical protein